jgi:hypothetical protein
MEAELKSVSLFFKEYSCHHFAIYDYNAVEVYR